MVLTRGTPDTRSLSAPGLIGYSPGKTFRYTTSLIVRLIIEIGANIFEFLICASHTIVDYCHIAVTQKSMGNTNM